MWRRPSTGVGDTISGLRFSIVQIEKKYTKSIFVYNDDEIVTQKWKCIVCRINSFMLKKTPVYPFLSILNLNI